MIIRPALHEDLEAIQKIAYQTWPVAYGTILSEAQMSYMLRNMYSIDVLRSQFESRNYLFLLAEIESPVGFCIGQLHIPEQHICRIHKLYVLPETQGSGCGKLLLDAISVKALESGCNRLHLNVNRNNLAITFYKRLGFEITSEEDIDIGENYLMEDYVMEKVF